MQNERDALVKLFRELAMEGKRRGVAVNLLDLRWGITNDQKRNGKVISTCLQEIDNSRPYFIGIIGDRYGWIPTEEEFMLNSELLDRFPMIDEYCRRKMSITEMEIRYGLLNSNNKAFFLIKENINIENDNHKKLIDDLLASGYPAVYYSTTEDIVKKVRKEIMSLLEESYPLLSELSELEKYENTQFNIAKELSEGYIPFSTHLTELERWLTSDKQYLVVSGEKGSGKSSLIAEWLQRIRIPRKNVVYHFLGSNYGEGNYIDLQHHILTRLETELGETPTPSRTIKGDEDYSLELEKAFKKVGEKGEDWLIVIDGIDHLEDNPMTKLMIWWPEEIPSSVKVLFTTNPEDLSHKKLCEGYGYENLILDFPDDNSVATIIREYLGKVGKALDETLINKIKVNSLFHNPSLLRLFLDELIVYGVHEKIETRIDFYLASTNKTEFYDRLLQHAEEYYGYETVRNILLTIALTKGGLSSETIIEILGLQPLDWSMLFCGLQSHFSFINGKYKFTDSDMKLAIFKRYGSPENGENEKIKPNQKKIISFLEKTESDFYELAFMYFQVSEWKKLHDILIDPERYIDILQHADNLFSVYWGALIEETDYSLWDYLEMEFRPVDNWDVNSQLFLLVQYASASFSDLRLAIALTEKRIDYYRKDNAASANQATPEDVDDVIASSYSTISIFYTQLGEWEEALSYIHKAETELTKINQPIIDSMLLFSKGNIFSSMGDYENSLTWHKKAIAIEKEVGGEIPWKYYNNLGLDYFYLGNYDTALNLFSDALNEVRRITTDLTLEGAMVLNNIGLVYLGKKEFSKAEKYFDNAIERYASNLSVPTIEVALTIGNRGLVAQKQNRFEEAEDYFNEAIEIEESLNPNSLNLALFLSNLGLNHKLLKNYDSAIECLLNSIDIYNANIGMGYDNYSQTCILLIETFIEAKRYEDALSMTEFVMDESKSDLGDLNPLQAECHLMIAEIFSHQNLKKQLIENEYRKAMRIYEQMKDRKMVKNIQKIIKNL
ncbi:MAG: tetratricopeptide repeat protein [Muribaculaceae bacterium]|nr:tetratricopeptide repeat protein [Muribaculaceae bacterium]